jgi:hypothetical protein
MLANASWWADFSIKATIAGVAKTFNKPDPWFKAVSLWSTFLDVLNRIEALSMII